MSNTESNFYWTGRIEGIFMTCEILHKKFGHGPSYQDLVKSVLTELNYCEEDITYWLDYYSKDLKDGVGYGTSDRL